jgi:hypothetical protein
MSSSENATPGHGTTVRAMCSRKVQVEEDHASVLVSEFDAPCLIFDVSWRSSRASEASVVGARQGEAGRAGSRAGCLSH